MKAKPEGTGSGTCWFVGAVYNGTDDQTPRFLAKGIWENGYRDKYLRLVRSIRPGDRIAIKSAYTRRRDLPFDPRGHTVSVMAIKALGTVLRNPGDGRKLKVRWTRLKAPREWYFYTFRGTVWKVQPGDWMNDALIRFAFENRRQDTDRFRNAPNWRERFGDHAVKEQRFNWTRFYEAVADRLLAFRDKRDELVAGIHDIATRVDGLSHLKDQFADGTSGPLRDICPFTVMGIFNRGITDANRRTIAAELARLLGVEEPVPDSFDGIPLLNNQRSWFFGYEKERQPSDIDALWAIFAEAAQYVASEDVDDRDEFVKAFDNAIRGSGVGWNLTMGLYWMRPWNFITLDSQSRRYIETRLKEKIGLSGPKGYCSADDYLNILDAIRGHFPEETYPVHSFPELSLVAWMGSPQEPGGPGQPGQGGEAPKPGKSATPYSVDDIVGEGCFLDRGKLESILGRLRTKKNLILQGPPGTGKSWLAKRLAFALVGQRDDKKVRPVQFHPNLSYEDFVRGLRPTGDGKLAFVDGPFMEMIKAALADPTARHVLVIEEINRGNPAQILGEMLTLLEADKRMPTEALELCYRITDDERVFIPDNLYVVGTMNIADRSLALVDLALRRRFAFVELHPVLDQAWHAWVNERCGVDATILTEIGKRVLALNDEISADPSLGRQFRIGHSYVTPSPGKHIGDAREWFGQVVDTEIGPLLDEYWFDALDKARKARQRLVEGL